MFLPAGSQDEVGQLLQNRARIYELFQYITTLRNYQAISTPVIEYAATFTNPHAGMKLQSMLKWFDEEGEIEVLRADWTTAVARAIHNQDSKRQKYAYSGSVFRRDKAGAESRQAGVEIVRAPHFYGESESLLTAAAFMEALTIQDYIVELGHTGIFDHLTASLKLNEEQAENLRAALHDKRKDEVYQIALEAGNEEAAAAIAALVDAYGGVEVLDAYEQNVKEPALQEILAEVRKIAGLLTDIGLEVLVDLGRVKHLPYYSGAMFRGFLKQNGAECFTGGRYDHLYKQFGESISAVGLAFDVDVLAETAVFDQRYEKVLIVTAPEAMAKAEKIRRSMTDAVVDVSFTAEAASQYDKIIELIATENGIEVKP